MTWRARAECAKPGGPKLDDYFPEPGQRGKVRRAKAICARCPVVQPCLREALEFMDEGIRGGTTAKERVQLRVMAGAQQHGGRRRQGAA